MALPDLPDDERYKLPVPVLLLIHSDIDGSNVAHSQSASGAIEPFHRIGIENKDDKTFRIRKYHQALTVFLENSQSAAE